MPSHDPRPPPEYVIWEITQKCNFRCFHCGASAGPARAGELTTEEALRLCEDLKTLGTPSVCLMGGEVFLRKDWVQIAGTLRDLGLNVGIITNGYLLSHEKVKEITKLGVCQVGISLDSARPEIHDAIRGVRGACEAAKRALRRVDDMPLTYKTVITSTSKKNIEELEGILQWLVRHTSGFTWMINIASSHDPVRFPREHLLDGPGFLKLIRFIHANRPACAGKLNVTGTHDTGYFSRSFPDLHDFTWQGCVAGIKTLGIQSNGNVKGCLMLGDAFSEGNVRQTRLVDLWNDGERFKINRNFSTDMLTGACRGCEHGLDCRGGCRDHAYSFTGSLYEYPFCLHRLETHGRLES
jgi:radical SAM protein with 4Fe4S-binding SPASM domain